MIKCEIISRFVGGTTTSINAYNKDVKDFINNLSVDGHTYISSKTIAFGSSMGELRTEIIYRENQTRKVITEKISSLPT